MLRHVFALMSFVVLILCFISIRATYAKKNRTAFFIRNTIRVCGLIVIFNCAAFESRNIIMADIFLSLYYACFDWLLLFVLFFASDYTQTYKYVQDDTLVRRIMMGYTVIESISLILNPVLHHVHGMKEIMFKGELYYVMANPTFYFRIHLFYSYALVILVALTFILKMRTLSTVYHKKYYPFLITFIGIVVLNAIYVLFNLPIDISIFCYSIGCSIMAYYSLFHRPKGVLEGIVTLVAGTLNDALVCFDIEDECIYYNELSKKYFDFDGEKIVLDEYIKNWVNDNRQHAKLEYYKWEFRDNVRTERMPKHYNIEFNLIKDKKGLEISYYFILHDATKEIETIEKERYRANHDPLTGVYNREHFIVKAEKLMRSKPDLEWYVVASNICDFKLINSLFGEDKGNDVLRKQAELLRATCQEGAVYGRFYADQFVLCLPKDRFVPHLFTDRITEMAQIYDNSLYHMKIKVGVYPVSDVNESITQMVDNAFEAIRSNTSSQEIISYFDDELYNQKLYEKSIINMLDLALENEEFKMYLQPQVDVASLKTIGAEALVRWQKSNGDLVPPFKFIPVLEKNGLIYKLDLYIWECAAKKIKAWDEAGIHDLYISVNISIYDFYYLNIYQTFKSLVEKYQINPKRLKIEITETAIMSKEDKQFDVIDDLRAYGFEVEIDDFGSGYSSLGYLKDMHADVVKIDMSFLSKSDDEYKAAVIFTSTMKLLKELGFAVVTEGVETQEQVDFIAKTGCDIYQGYFFDRPIPVEEFESKYLKR